ncbi:MAG: hypothetical protein KTR17_00790, partial [Cellvibrionaceae bacterium]|nr:hypothetical protein [Cellvibrionaceae bacterium]
PITSALENGCVATIYKYSFSFFLSGKLLLHLCNEFKLYLPPYGRTASYADAAYWEAVIAEFMLSVCAYDTHPNEIQISL